MKDLTKREAEVFKEVLMADLEHLANLTTETTLALIEAEPPEDELKQMLHGMTLAALGKAAEFSLARYAQIEQNGVEDDEDEVNPLAAFLSSAKKVKAREDVTEEELDAMNDPGPRQKKLDPTKK